MKGSETLKITLPTDREVVITRVFDAPRQLVFEALSKPDLLKRWFVAPGRSLETCDIDFRPGGAYRFVWRGPGKRDVGTYGTYREIVAPERFVYTESWEDWDAGELLVTTVLTAQGKATLFTHTAIYPSREVRDAVFKAGLEKGAQESYDHLAGLLAALDRSR